MKLFFIILLLPVFVFTQTVADPDSIKMDEVFGLSFGLRNLDLDKFEGGIGGKYWFSNDYSIYLSLDFSFSDRAHAQSNSNYFSSGFSTGIQKHFFVKKIVSPFIGIGFACIGRYSETKDKNYGDLSSLKRHYESTTYKYSAGITGGVEVFALEFLSLSAHYGIWVWYEEDDDKRNYNDGRQEQSKYESIFINSGVSSLNVTIYF